MKNRGKKDSALELAMVVDGHHIYKYRDINHMPFFREAVVRVGYAKTELGLRNEDLKVYCEMQIALLNEGNNAKAAQLTGFLEMQLDNYASMRVALEIGGYAILVDDEPHAQVTDRHNGIKEKLLSKHGSVVNFFLAESVGHISALNNSIQPSLQMGLLKDPTRLAKEKMFLALMQVDMFKGLWTPLTPPHSDWQKLVAALLPKKY